MRKILVWDFPTRAFHWLLALSFVEELIDIKFSPEVAP
jgi:cytochrome b